MPRAWTDTEIAALRSLFPDMPNDSIAAALGRTDRAIKSMAQYLGLKKSAEYHQKYTSRFQAGHTSWNKGKKGWKAGGRSAETRFKPGRDPKTAHNYLPIGTVRERDDGYLERKYTDDQSLYPAARWKLCHVECWEQHHGPVPENHVVAFINGDRRDIRIDNLECISRAELMARNTVHTLPKELAELCQLRGALNRQINQRKSA